MSKITKIPDDLPERLDLEIQSNTKMKEEYRQLDELCKYQVERIKELKEILIDAGKGTHKSKLLHDWYCKNTEVDNGK